MKLAWSGVIAILTVLSQSCTSIYFSVPQPKGSPDLASFPAAVQGTYTADEDLDTLFIIGNGYQYPEEFERRIPMSDLDSVPEITFDGDLLFDSSLPEKRGIRFTISNDTLHYKVRLYVTRQLSDSLVLKKLGSWLILSEREKPDAYWEVYLIEKQAGGDLKAYAVKNLEVEDSESDREYDGRLSDFYSITNFQKIGESDYLVDPSRRELKKLIKKGLFKEVSRFRRVRTN